MSLLPSLPRRPSTWSMTSTSQPPTPAAGSTPVKSAKNKTILANSSTTFDPQSIFRHTEKVVTSQSCRVRKGYAPFVKAEALLVTSKKESGDQAAIFIVVPPSETEAASILYSIPIIPGFKHRLEQTPPSPSTSFFQQSAKPHITLYLSCEDTKLELRISASQTAKVQKLVAELRKLSDTAVQSPTPRSLTHSWLDLYPAQPPKENDNVDALGSPEVETPGVLTPSTSTGAMTLDTPLSSVAEAIQATPATPADAAAEEDEHPDPYLPTFSRTEFLRKRLYARQEKWSTRAEMKIRIATYNVNDKIPPEGTLELAPLAGKGEEDLLVFGFQEADLRRQSLLISQGNSRAEGWEAALLAGLGPKAEEFEKLVMTQYVGVLMIILVRKTLKEAISRVETSERGIGLLGFGGNKAGVAVRLKIHDTTLCFVNAHMAAFATALERRRYDYQTLKAGLTFARPGEADLTPAFEEFLPEPKEKLLTQEDSHVLFWLGDLNYRIDLPDSDVKKLVEEKKWEDMLAKDQLRSDIVSEQSFTGFTEPEISFPPTFKYVHGSTTHDLRRAPAYTDRIIYHYPTNPYTASSTFDLKCDEYTSHDILWSDHRPVTASYSAQVRVADESSRGVELAAVMKELDRLEEVYRPSLEIDGTSLEFGQVMYRQPVIREVKLRNVGRVPATYNFKPPSSDKPICKPFMWPFPATAVVEPGQDVTLKVVVCVDELAAAKLTLGDDINDVFVLQIAGGKDFFITIQAVFQPSIIALPLHVLSALPSPIRHVPLADRKILARPLAPSTTNGEAPAKPVRDVWRLLEYLMANGTGVEDLWVANQDVRDIIECLDTGVALPEESARTISVALLHILTALPTPLLPISHHTPCLSAEDRDAAFAVLEGVPQINTNVLIGLMSVVRLCSGAEDDREPKSIAEQETAKPVEVIPDEATLGVEDESTKTSTGAIKEAGLVEPPGQDETFKIEDDDAEDEDEDDVKISDNDATANTSDAPAGAVKKDEALKDDVDGLDSKLDEVSLADDEPTKTDTTSAVSKELEEFKEAGQMQTVKASQEATRSDKEEGKVVTFASPPKRGDSSLPAPVTPPAQTSALPAAVGTAHQPSEALVDALCPAIFGQTTAVGITRDKRRRFVKLLLEG
ncbi:hypothetical protein I317_02359 [Kwoniella heveanensis CBS 569]|nr:hypothetical protein I317_02359 [Kwoniella heveanensis CBS 569]